MPFTAMAPEPVAVWFTWRVVPLPAVAKMALPFPVLVACTAGVLVELVKDAGLWVAALAAPAGSSSMAPTMPATPTAAVLAMPRRVSPKGPR
jgi:hypothetical protein